MVSYEVGFLSIIAFNLCAEHYTSHNRHLPRMGHTTMIKLILIQILLLMISSRIAVGEERFIEKRISVITNFSEKDAIAKILLKKFSDTLNGDAPKDMVIKYDYYWSEGSPETAKIHAKKIVSSKPDVIFCRNHTRSTRPVAGNQNHTYCFCNCS